MLTCRALPHLRLDSSVLSSDRPPHGTPCARIPPVSLRELVHYACCAAAWIGSSCAAAAAGAHGRARRSWKRGLPSTGEAPPIV